ncbi:MAG: hypothetical protein RIB63_22630 [Fulvivirga sp.]
MKELALWILIILIVVGCSNSGQNIESQAGAKPVAKDSLSATNLIKKEDRAIITKNPNQGEIYPIKPAGRINGVGVLVMKTGKDLLSTETIELFNDDMSIYAQWNYNDESFTIDNEPVPLFSVDAIRLKDDHEFLPRAFFTEYQIIHFEVKSKDGSYYEVLVNPDRRTTKKVRISSSHFEYYTWEEYLKLFYLMFDPLKNPLRESPDEQSEIVYKYNDYFFKAVEIRGDWVKLKCDGDCKPCDNGELVGWVKWKEGTTILLSIGYIC